MGKILVDSKLKTGYNEQDYRILKKFKAFLSLKEMQTIRGKSRKAQGIKGMPTNLQEFQNLKQINPKYCFRFTHLCKPLRQFQSQIHAFSFHKRWFRRNFEADIDRNRHEYYTWIWWYSRRGIWKHQKWRSNDRPRDRNPNPGKCRDLWNSHFHPLQCKQSRRCRRLRFGRCSFEQIHHRFLVVKPEKKMVKEKSIIIENKFTNHASLKSELFSFGILEHINWQIRVIVE